MALKLKLPNHRIDAPAVWISISDPAWDNDKFDADNKAFQAQELESAKSAALDKYRLANRGRELTQDEIAAVTNAVVLTGVMKAQAYIRTPVGRYFRGKTRFSLDAKDTDGAGAPCTVRDFLKPGVQPTEFILKRLNYRDYQRADAMKDGDGDYGAMCLTEFCRLGLKGIKSPDLTWHAEPDKYVPEEIMQALHDADVSLSSAIGMAVIQLCRPLDAEETLT